jgi:hypothetical protein
MDEFDELLHRTWVQLIIDNGYREVAAIAIETDASILHSGCQPVSIAFDIPTSTYVHVKNNEQIKKVMEQQFQIQNRNKRYIILKVKLTRICKHRSITKHKFN